MTVKKTAAPARVGIALGIVALAAAALAGGEAVHLSQTMASESGRIALGVRIADVPVGGLPFDLARKAVRGWARRQLAKSVLSKWTWGIRNAKSPMPKFTSKSVVEAPMSLPNVKRLDVNLH